VEGVSLTEAARKAPLAAGRSIWDRVGAALGEETPFPEKEVTPRNNSSLITLLHLDGNRLLLTDDAGVPALSRALDFAERHGLDGDLDFLQVPHHGARRNASSAFLDRLVGPAGQAEGARTAFVSVSPGCAHEHPSGRVINAYQRRSCRVIATAGESKCSISGVPLRAGSVAATPLGPMVEEPEAEAR
jgi:beta-lactamase superfamily II metal-dependent hydrolase